MSKDSYRSPINAACHDTPFIIFLCILTIKSILFIYISYRETMTVFQFLVTFLPSFGILLALLSISLLFKKSVLKLAYLFFLDLLLSLLYLTQSLYFHYFEDFASLYNLNQIPLLGSIVHVIIGMIGKEILFIIDLLFMPFLLPWLKKKDSATTSLSWVQSLSFFYF